MRLQTPSSLFSPSHCCLLFPSPSLAGRKDLRIWFFSLYPSQLSLWKVLPLRSPQNSQLPLVVAMQERVGGSPHCKVAAACVHQDVELSEKGKRNALWTDGSGLSSLMAPHPTATFSYWDVQAEASMMQDQPGWHPLVPQLQTEPGVHGTFNLASEMLCLLLFIELTFSVSSEPHWMCVFTVPISIFRWPLLSEACLFPSFLILPGRSLLHPTPSPSS